MSSSRYSRYSSRDNNDYTSAATNEDLPTSFTFSYDPNDPANRKQVTNSPLLDNDYQNSTPFNSRENDPSYYKPTHVNKKITQLLDDLEREHAPAHQQAGNSFSSAFQRLSFQSTKRIKQSLTRLGKTDETEKTVKTMEEKFEIPQDQVALDQKRRKMLAGAVVGLVLLFVIVLAVSLNNDHKDEGASQPPEEIPEPPSEFPRLFSEETTLEEVNKVYGANQTTSGAGDVKYLPNGLFGRRRGEKFQVFDVLEESNAELKLLVASECLVNAEYAIVSSCVTAVYESGWAQTIGSCYCDADEGGSAEPQILDVEGKTVERVVFSTSVDGSGREKLHAFALTFKGGDESEGNDLFRVGNLELINGTIADDMILYEKDFSNDPVQKKLAGLYGYLNAHEEHINSMGFVFKNNI